MYEMQRRSFPFTAPGGAPKSLFPKADKYMACCITSSLKRVSSMSSSGVYVTTGTDGRTRDMADTARVLSLASTHRKTPPIAPVGARFGAAFEARNKAIILSHGCSYEEALFSRMPDAAAAFVAASAEAAGLCSRAVDLSALSVQERYMMDCVDSQGKKMNDAPFGTYTTNCSDGSTKLAAEYKRAIGLAARFRAAALPVGIKAQMAYVDCVDNDDQYGRNRIWPVSRATFAINGNDDIRTRLSRRKAITADDESGRPADETQIHGKRTMGCLSSQHRFCEKNGRDKNEADAYFKHQTNAQPTNQKTPIKINKNQIFWRQTTNRESQAKNNQKPTLWRQPILGNYNSEKNP